MHTWDKGTIRNRETLKEKRQIYKRFMVWGLGFIEHITGHCKFIYKSSCSSFLNSSTLSLYNYN